MTKKKAYNPIRDVIDLTKMNVAASAGGIVLGSFPDVPQVPAFGQVKSFGMTGLGLMSLVGGSSVALNSLKRLEEMGEHQRSKRRK